MRKNRGCNREKRTKEVLFLTLLILGIGLLGGALSYAQQQEEKLPQNAILLYEKKYESEVKQVVLREDGNLKAVATAKKVIFYGDKGEVINEIPLKVVPRSKSAEGVDEEAQLSPNGEYALIESVVIEFEWDMSYVDTKGKVLWKREKVYGYAVISPDGQYIVIVGREGRIEFLNKIGKVLSITEYEAEPWGTRKGIFSGDGNYFALVLEKTATAEAHKLIFFTKNGIVLWEHKLEARPVDIKVSYAGRAVIWLATKEGGIAFLFNKEGALIKQMQGMTRTIWDRLTFSPGGDLLTEAIPERHFSSKIKGSRLTVYEVLP